MAYIVKSEQGKAKIYENKVYKRSVGSNVIALDWNDEWVVCVEKNIVKQYSISNGLYKRSYSSVKDAVGVNISGDSIAIKCANGKVKEYRASNGSYVKSY